MNRRRRARGRRASTLFLVLVVAILAVASFFAMVSTATFERAVALTEDREDRLYWIADGGFEWTLARFASGELSPLADRRPLGGGSFDIRVRAIPLEKSRLLVCITARTQGTAGGDAVAAWEGVVQNDAGAWKRVAWRRVSHLD